MAETQKHGEQHEQDYRLKHDCRGDTGRRDALERCRAGRRKRVRILPRRLFVRNATVRLRHGGAVRRHDFRSRRQLRSKSAAVRGERLLRSRAEAPRPYASSTSGLTANGPRLVCFCARTFACERQLPFNRLWSRRLAPAPTTSSISSYCNKESAVVMCLGRTADARGMLLTAVSRR